MYARTRRTRRSSQRRRYLRRPAEKPIVVHGGGDGYDDAAPDTVETATRRLCGSCPPRRTRTSTDRTPVSFLSFFLVPRGFFVTGFWSPPPGESLTFGRTHQCTVTARRLNAIIKPWLTTHLGPRNTKHLERPSIL